MSETKPQKTVSPAPQAPAAQAAPTSLSPEQARIQELEMELARERAKTIEKSQQSQMVAKPLEGKIEMVKIKARRHIRMYHPSQQHLPKGQRTYFVLAPGDVQSVPREIAEQVCAKREGQFAFGGERLNGPEVQRHQDHKATLVS